MKYVICRGIVMGIYFLLLVFRWISFRKQSRGQGTVDWRFLRLCRGVLKLDLVLCISWFECGFVVLQRGGVGGVVIDLLKGREGAVFFYCYRDGLGIFVVKEVGCQVGRRGIGVSERELVMKVFVFIYQGIQIVFLICIEDRMEFVRIVWFMFVGVFVCFRRCVRYVFWIIVSNFDNFMRGGSRFY